MHSTFTCSISLHFFQDHLKLVFFSLSSFPSVTSSLRIPPFNPHTLHFVKLNSSFCLSRHVLPNTAKCYLSNPRCSANLEGSMKHIVFDTDPAADRKIQRNIALSKTVPHYFVTFNASLVFSCVKDGLSDCTQVGWHTFTSKWIPVEPCFLHQRKVRLISMDEISDPWIRSLLLLMCQIYTYTTISSMSHIHCGFLTTESALST